MPTIPKKAKKKVQSTYELVTISDPSAGEDQGPDLGPLKSEGPFVVHGNVLGSVIVSTPETVTQRTANDLSDKFSEHFGKEVIVVTRNIQFLKLRKLRAGEAKEVAKRIPDAEARCLQCRYTPAKDEAGDLTGHIVEIGPDEPTVLFKAFGPEEFKTLRVTSNSEREEWVIERENADHSWLEVGRFPATAASGDGESGGK